MGIFGTCFLSFLQENKIILLEAKTRIKSIWDFCVFFALSKEKEVKQMKLQNFSEWSRFGAISLSTDLNHSSVLGVKELRE